MSNSVPDEVKRNLDQLFNAFSTVAEGTYVYLCNMKYDYSRWSESAVTSFGLPSEYMFGAGAIWEEHIHPEDRENYHRSIDAIFSGQDDGHDMQYRARKPNGDYEVCTCRGVVICDQNGEPEYFGGAIRNHGVQGHIDTLVGLRNQYGFFEDLESYLVKKRSVRISVIGLSKFTEINEVYGYLFGNQVLQRFGRYLFEHIGNRGHVYRLDGTKFAVISVTLSTGELKAEYEKLRTYFRDGCEVDGRHIILDMSAGILSLDDFTVDVQTIYSCLNFAFGESKIRQQGDMVEFVNELNDDSQQRLEMLHAIRDSITRDCRGFCLYYQPVVNAVSGRLTGAESLIRWRDETYGMVMPDRFIPLLERDSLFPQLGRWILKKSLCDAKKVLSVCPDFVVNVNLSYTQLEKPDFPDMVLELLREVDYPPEHLCLEITERCRLLDLGQLLNIVARLRASGIRFALDDFGTGFSSIGVIKAIPLDTIKIDRSFVIHIEKNAQEQQLVEHFTAVAALFGAKVCVEGIETAGMRDILRHYRVHSFQGYYYGRPMDFGAFLFLARSQPVDAPAKAR
ncbi:MAG: EAL domain-containing protein [Ruminococcaceae bacterium]|nr:EAL domain-containing protein [Oscillospiraceae bacterium]